jgi:hypothetical protein
VDYGISFTWEFNKPWSPELASPVRSGWLKGYLWVKHRKDKPGRGWVYYPGTAIWWIKGFGLDFGANAHFPFGIDVAPDR